MLSRLCRYRCIPAVLVHGIAACLLAGMAAAHDMPAPPPGSADAAFPAAMKELALRSNGARLNGLLYQAQGKGPHPTIVLLHGFPGNERNLDLAQAYRRGGYNVLYFNYRGAWGSGGEFSFSNARADVAAVLAWARQEGNAGRLRIDPARLILAGHSMGGWLAFAGAVDDPAVQCTMAMAPWNLGRFAGMLSTSPHFQEDFLAEAKSYTDPAGGPLRGTSPAALMEEARLHIGDWDVGTFARPLAKRPVMVIVSRQDEASSPDMQMQPLATRVKALNARRWEWHTIDDDHAFSAHRLMLATMTLDWLKRECGPVKPPAK